MKYLVNLDDAMKSLPQLWNRASMWVSSSVWCINSKEIEEDSFLMMELYGTIIQYKIMSKTQRELRDFESIHGPHSFQFITSFAGV